LLVATGFWQSVRCPLLVTPQVTPFFAALLGDAAADGADDALALGLADTLGLGVAAAAIPLSDSVPAAVRISTADSWRMPDARIRLNAGTSSGELVITAETSAESGGLQVRERGCPGRTTVDDNDVKNSS
jgi:hypothetical protein